MKTQLIQDWDVRPLGEVVKPSRPRIKPSEKPDLPFIGMEHVEAHTMKLLGTVPAGTMKSSAVHFKPDDVLYGRLRPYLNKVYRPDFEGLCSAEFIVFPKRQGLNSRYLQYFLNSASFVSFASHLNAGDRPRVDFDQLASHPIPIPPFNQQELIVAEIEKQFSRLDEAVANIKRIKANLKRYKAAFLKAAVEAKLTEKCRKTHPDVEPASKLLERILTERRAKWKGKGKYKESENLVTKNLPFIPITWKWASLDQLLLNITDGDHQPPPQTDSGVPFLVIGNIRSGKLKFEDTRFVSQEYADSVDTYRKPTRGDILYSLVGSYGIALVVNTKREFCVQRHIGILRPHQLSPISFLAHVLNSPLVFKQATAVATGIAQKTVPLAGLRRFAIPLPPFEDQGQIVSEVERRLSVIKELEVKVKANFARVDNLRQSPLKLLFSGNHHN